jgi:hypothetical protein
MTGTIRLTLHIFETSESVWRGYVYIMQYGNMRMCWREDSHDHTVSTLDYFNS